MDATKGFLCQIASIIALFLAAGVGPVSAETAIAEHGIVTGAGQPITGATVTLWAATGEAAPSRIAQSVTGPGGEFSLQGRWVAGTEVLYVVALGGHSGRDASSRGNAAIG